MPNPIQRRHHASVLTGGLFIPPDAVNLKSRWQASIGTWKDTGLTTLAVADGDLVGGWEDRVGGFTATQAVSGTQPVLKLNVFGGNMPGLLFTAASGQFMAADTLAATYSGSGVPFTFIAVYKLTATGVACAQVSVGRVSVATTYDLLQLSAGNIPGMTRRDDAGTNVVAGTNNFTSLASECIIGTYDGTSSLSVYLGGKLVQSVAATSTVMTTDEFSLGVWRRGAGVNASFMGGHMAEVAAYRSSLSDVQVLQWAKYANRTYGAALR